MCAQISRLKTRDIIISLENISGIKLMSTTKNKAPKQVILSAQEASALKERVKKSNLSQKDLDIMLGLIGFNFWLQERLSRAKLTINRLRQLFGFKRESSKKSKKNNNEPESNTPDASSDDASEDQAITSDPPKDNQNRNKMMTAVPQWDLDKNHGRTSARDYTGCALTTVGFEDQLIKSGYCPKCAEHQTEARLYSVEPTMLIFLESKPLISGERYELKKVRCSVCQAYFTASLPEKFKDRPKYSPGCVTTLCIHHYYGGLPFKRLETLQRLSGVPMADATQYDLVNQFYSAIVQRLVAVLKQKAANGNALFFDDTTGRILEQIIQNKQAENPKNKVSVNATALLSEHEGHRIYLFDTNTLTAGKQLSETLEERTSDDHFITMSDASASNFPTLNDDLLARWTITLCLSHARRRFVELLSDGDQDIQFILNLIGRVYQNDRNCKDQQLDDTQRLEYHQRHSAKLMESLKTWLNNLMLFKKVEPNSRLGEAISYLLKRWHWLTQFLHVPGAKLDNNICEQAIKILIRYRKASLFYRTFYGASIGDAMMSLLHTAAHAGVNIFDYLNRLQQHAQAVQASPEQWLPWNYKETLATLEQPTPVATSTA
ncbi:MAG: transposase [Gammaproteobacteria bacterium]|nr:transposase [Gammaproteobacteria bacterium]